MNTLLETPYQLLREHPEEDLYVHYWTSLTAELDAKGIWQELALMKSAMLSRPVRHKNLYTDATDLNFSVSKDMRTWIASELVPELYQAGIRRQAILASENLPVAMSGELMADAIKKTFPQYEIRIFYHLKEVALWLVNLSPLPKGDSGIEPFSSPKN